MYTLIIVQTKTKKNDWIFEHIDVYRTDTSSFFNNDLTVAEKDHLLLLQNRAKPNSKICK